MRFEDTPDLFGRGMGTSTSQSFTCGWCGTKIKGDESGYDTVGTTDFGSKEICDQCWEEVENAVLQRMGDILPWYKRILDAKKAGIAKMETKLKEVTG